MNIAVLYCVFNRLDTVKKTFAPIKDAKPKRLYISCDGPRADREGEAEVVEKIRSYILNNIDWDCQVNTLFRDKNVGCNAAITGALEWFFQNEEMGIIIEDDILTSPQFFEFMEKMLIKYKDNEKVHGVSGYGFSPGAEEFLKNNGYTDEFYDYYFMPRLITWGWACWRRSFTKLFLTKDERKSLSLDLYKKVFKNEISARCYYLEKDIDSWDINVHQKCYLLANEGYCSILSRPALVSNIGEVGTHYTEANSYINRPIDDIDIENMNEPTEVKIDFDFWGWQSEIGLTHNYNKIYGGEKINYLKITKDLLKLKVKLLARYLKMITAPKNKRLKRESKYKNIEHDIWMLNKYKELVKTK